MSGTEIGPERFLAVESAGGASWHPNSSEFVFVYDAPGNFQVYHSYVDEGRSIWPDRLTYERDRCTNPRYLSDGSIIFTRDFEGNENFQIGHIDTKGHLSWITDDEKAKHIPTFIDDDAVYYNANIEDKSRLDIYRHKLPILNNDPELILKTTKGRMAILEVSKDKSVAIIHHMQGNARHNLLLFDLNDGTTTPITESLNERDSRWLPVGFIDDDHILVRTDHRSDYMRLTSLSLKGEFGTFEEIERTTRYPYEHTATSKGTQYVYYSVNEEGYNRVYRARFTQDSMKDVEEIRLPMEGVIGSGDHRTYTRGMALSPDGKKLAISLSSSVEPANIWIINTQTMNTWKATNVQMASLNTSMFAKASLSRFSSFDGLSVPYFKYCPKGKMPEKGWPTVFMIHGGPEAQIRPGFNPVIQFYINAGYAVITPNIRGSTGYGKTYLDMDNVEKRLDAIRDIEQLYQHIRISDDAIDSSRVVVYGGSYGGFAVLSAITEYPTLWKAAVDIVGISNFVTFLKNTAAWRRSNREYEYGSLEQDIETLERISPIHKVDRITCPLFIIQGDNDERVPLSESIQIYEALKKKGIPVELMRFSDEGHGLSRLSNKIRAYTRVLAWLNEIV